MKILILLLLLCAASSFQYQINGTCPDFLDCMNPEIDIMNTEVYLHGGFLMISNHLFNDRFGSEFGSCNTIYDYHIRSFKSALMSISPLAIFPTRLNLLNMSSTICKKTYFLLLFFKTIFDIKVSTQN